MLKLKKLALKGRTARKELINFLAVHNRPFGGKNDERSINPYSRDVWTFQLAKGLRIPFSFLLSDVLWKIIKLAFQLGLLSGAFIALLIFKLI